jgi:hypothetical protein
MPWLCRARVTITRQHSRVLQRVARRHPGPLVVHGRVLLLVPEHRHRESAGVNRVCTEVEVLDMLGLVERVIVGSWEGVYEREGPAVRAHSGRDNVGGCLFYTKQAGVCVCV